MKILIVYDSDFGNTEKIAKAIGEGFSKSDKVKLLTAEKATLKELEKIDLLIVGSPTQGGRSTGKMQKFLDKLSPNILKGLGVCAFDTRFLEKNQNIALQILMKTIGYAAPKIAETLESKAAKLLVKPEGFIVEKKEGPLAKGELERAKKWAKGLVK